MPFDGLRHDDNPGLITAAFDEARDHDDRIIAAQHRRAQVCYRVAEILIALFLAAVAIATIAIVPF